MAKHVFLTHAAEDKAIAVLVCEALEKAGIQCWYAPRNVPLGMNFEEAIIDAISTSGLMILILSAHSNNSPHVKREIQNACIENVQVPILPFRVEDIPLNKALRYYLGSTQWLDASTPPLEAHLGTLVKHVEASLSQAPPAESEEQAHQRVEQEAAAWKLAEDKEAQRIAELHAAGLAESARLRAAKEAAALKLADAQRLAEQREAVRLAESARLRAEKDSADLKLDEKKETHRLAEQREVVRQAEAALAAAQIEQDHAEKRQAPPPVAEKDAYRLSIEAAENVVQKAAVVHGTENRSLDASPSFELRQFEKKPNRTLWYIGGGAALALLGLIVVISYIATNNASPGAGPSPIVAASASPSTDQNTPAANNDNVSPGVANLNTNRLEPHRRPSPAYSSPTPVRRATVEEQPTREPTPSRTSAPIRGGVLNGKAISLPRPAYPPLAKAAHASGTVVVQITIDENGDVISARASSGHPLLQAAAVEAARQAKFSTTRLSGRPVKVTGVITYNFVAQ